MVIVDAGKMLRLDAAEADAERRYHTAMMRGDTEAARVAAREWTEAARAVEPYSDS